MDEIKLIKRLPELKDHQEWGCSSGCGLVTPKLYRRVYAESWDLNGVKIREMAENYYTCQCNHALEVWDNNANDYVVLPDEAYQVRTNEFNHSLESIAEARKFLKSVEQEFSVLGSLQASISITLKGRLVEINHPYLDEIEAELKAEMVLG